MTAQAELNPYPRYRASGVAWLGDVPEHWDAVQLGRIGVFSKGSGGTKDDEVPAGIPCVRYGDLYTTHKYFISQTRSYISPAKASSYTEIKRGDVLFPTSGETIEEIGKSAVNLMDTQVLCGGDLIIFRPTIPMEPKFAGYALDCTDAQTQKSMMGRGITIMHIYSGQLKYLWLPLPPLDEQAAIVRYLEYADGRIRRYVGAKGRLIALLEEERQAVVNQAVTRGLDAEVALKPSGVEWLGDVPAHWEVRRLKSLCKLVNGATPSTNQPSYWNGDIQWITPQDLGNLAGKYITESERRITAAGYRSCGTALAPAGSIAISTRAPIGHIAVLASDACVNQGCRLLVPGDRCDSDYLYYQLTTVRNELEAQGQGSTFTELSRDKLAAFQVAAPPKDEQAAIVEYVDRATAGIDAAMARARRQMELVEEYRVRLIADVVTGKVDVRDGAAGLPGDCP